MPYLDAVVSRLDMRSSHGDMVPVSILWTSRHYRCDALSRWDMDASPRAHDAPRQSRHDASEDARYRSAHLEVDALRAVLGDESGVPPEPQSESPEGRSLLSRSPSSRRSSL